MKSTLSIFAAASLLAVSVVTADTLELADGTLLEGDMVGSSNGIIMFNTGDDIEAYPESEVVGIYLSEGVATRQQELQKQQNQPQTITVAEGTRLVIRMSETIDTKRHSAGYRFRGQRFDCGSKAGFLQATVAFGLARPELREEFSQYLTELVSMRNAAQ